MAKNEIKMLLLGAGESGKVLSALLFTPPYWEYMFVATVDGAQTDEVDSPRGLQWARKGIIQGNHLFKHYSVDAVNKSYLVWFGSHWTLLMQGHPRSFVSARSAAQSAERRKACHNPCLAASNRIRRSTSWCGRRGSVSLAWSCCQRGCPAVSRVPAKWLCSLLLQCYWSDVIAWLHANRSRYT